MSTITVRDLDDEVRRRLRVRAATAGRSMEAEIRLILADAVRSSSAVERSLGAWIAEELGGVEDDEPGLFDVRRDDRVRPVDLDEAGGVDRDSTA
ncbi:FitA-like ribbon-helix-helix domain-containing protein [Isoptericola sp. NPDC019693]|uniref:FitA-like ribbon-helix-helix domain-containing protein n=1 Tax=Isoptericola sp. NPDC019693 TaxID=3364009 RepID=UPI0037B58216